jgi:hypothetical protein
VGVALLLSGRVASAAAMLQYDTTGWVNLANVTTNGSTNTPVQFDGVQTANFDAAAPFSLGRFVIPQGTSSDIALDNAAFSVHVEIPSLYRVVTVPASSGNAADYPLKTYYDPGFTVLGHLSGTIIHGKPELTATIDSVAPFGGQPYPADGAIKYGLPFSVDSVNLPKTFAINSVGADGGSAPLVAQVVPEPATVLVFLTAIAGYVLRSRRPRNS